MDLLIFSISSCVSFGSLYFLDFICVSVITFVYICVYVFSYNPFDFSETSSNVPSLISEFHNLNLLSFLLVNLGKICQFIDLFKSSTIGSMYFSIAFLSLVLLISALIIIVFFFLLDLS